MGVECTFSRKYNKLKYCYIYYKYMLGKHLYYCNVGLHAAIERDP